MWLGVEASFDGMTTAFSVVYTAPNFPDDSVWFISYQLPELNGGGTFLLLCHGNFNKFKSKLKKTKKKKMTDWFSWVNAASFCFRLPSIESWMIVIDLKKTGFTNNYDIMKECYHPLRWSGDRWWCWLRCNDYHKVAALSDFKTRLRSIKIFPRQFALKSLRLCSQSDKNQFASFQLSSLEIWIEWVNS